MNWADYAVPLVAAFEGCAKRENGMIVPYLDSLAKPPVWTRGYGRTFGISQESPAITVEAAREELAIWLTRYAASCVAMAPSLASRPECLAAVCSWAWNCGLGAFKQSRLRKAIVQDRWEDAAEYILRPRTAGGVKLRGLARRREAEAALFRKGI